MNFSLLINSRVVRHLPLVILIIALFVPHSESPAAQATEVIVDDPQLHPSFTTCPQTYWYPFDNDRGHTAYVTLNTNDPLHSTNHGEWHPIILQAGYYRVEAYIAGHDPIIWCTGEGRTIDHDTTEAHYSIHHAYGVYTRSLSQYPLSNQWLDLGEYYFNAGDSGYVYLTDLNNETEYGTTVSFSAMRFTFTRPTRPRIFLPLIHHTDPSGQPPPNVGVIHAQGFDACVLPTISQMQTWWNKSPYSFYGLYLGGIHLPSVCGGANTAWVNAVHQQGWSFVPTWVGPQAPCSGYLHKMNSDPAISYQEGRQEAQSASAAAASLGLTNYGWGGTIIYYDMEPYGIPSPECRQPVAAFMNGWTQQLHELGNLAGGYGTRNSYLSDWSTIPNIPDDVWPASWYTNNYDPYATVYGISWLEGLWTDHQRIRQYAGDINNSWGGVSLNIDIDVADGMVAMPPSGLLTNPIVTSSPSIEDAGWLSVEQGWLVSGEHLYWTHDQGKNWVDISPAPIQLAYFLPSGQAWALSAQNQEYASLYHSSNWGTTWENLDLTLPADGWWPLQLQFTTPDIGWVVMQKETSQAFDVGTLMKTSDGGLTWQITKLDDYPLSQSLLPEGTTLSGWQATGLGWAVTSIGSCSGEKSTPSFTCQINTELWQTQDGGETWDSVPLPVR